MVVENMLGSVVNVYFFGEKFFEKFWMHATRRKPRGRRVTEVKVQILLVLLLQ